MAISVRQQKLALRQEARERLAGLSESERGLRSRNLCRRIQDSPGYKSASTVMLYLATPEEVDLAEVAQRAAADGRRLCLPRMDWAAKTMAPLLVDWRALRLEVREHGISEPVSGNSLPLESLDLVLVPGLAFDSEGRRLGRGAGFYDRFLEAFREARKPTAVALGVCFEVQVVERIPAEKHDQPMDGLATERRVMLCRKSGPRADKK